MHRTLRQESAAHPLLVAGCAAAGLAIAGQWALRWSRYMDLRGRTVLITGGSRGLGLVLARQLAQQGARLAICARDEEELLSARVDLASRGADVLAVQCDVTVREQIEGMIEGVIRHFGAIDVLVNNAGVISVGPMEVMTLEDYQLAMNTHFWAPLYATLAVLPHMRRRRFGRIVNISSIGGKIAAPHLLPYSASKFALVGFSEGLRSEVMKDNIYVTTVCPGLMRTGSTRNAIFKGRHRDEYAWFAISDSLPVTSISAQRAASRIIKACRYGEAEVVLSIQAKLAVKFHDLFPGLTSDINALLNGMLPSPGGIGVRHATGRQSQSPITQSSLTYLDQQAAMANNEGRL